MDLLNKILDRLETAKKFATETAPDFIDGIAYGMENVTEAMRDAEKFLRDLAKPKAGTDQVSYPAAVARLEALAAVPVAVVVPGPLPEPEPAGLGPVAQLLLRRLVAEIAKRLLDNLNK